MSTIYTDTISDIECIGDSLDKINNNFENLGTAVVNASSTLTTRISNVSTQVLSVSSQVFGAGSTLQTVFNQVTPGAAITLGNAGIVTEITQLPPITLTRKSRTSSLILELNGGRYSAGTGAGMSTWFYVNSGTGVFGSVTGSPAVQYANEFIYIAGTAANLQAAHAIRYLYQPPVSVSAVSIKIYAASYAVNSQVWTSSDIAGSIPITYSITEIA